MQERAIFFTDREDNGLRKIHTPFGGRHVKNWEGINTRQITLCTRNLVTVICCFLVELSLWWGWGEPRKLI